MGFLVMERLTHIFGCCPLNRHLNTEPHWDCVGIWVIDTMADTAC